jgi:regulator of protease activity HflC (stomatin/prohibitin superfamily)
MRTRVLTLQQQPVLTKDNITVRIQTAIYFRVIDSQRVAYKLGALASETNNFIS